MIRKDWNDQIFRTEKEKQDAIISKVKMLNSKGQPLLIFTSSGDKSEIYSELFRKNKSDFDYIHYLTAREDIVHNFKEKLNNHKDKLKIGISWKSVVNIYGSLKSLSIKDFEPLFMDNRLIINLQYGDIDSDKKYIFDQNKYLEVFSDLDLFNDIESCMGLLKNLDLFITVSNSTAHFAGALGIPTIIICPKKSSTYYYWNTQTGSSIWYKNIKVLGIEKSIKETVNVINNILEKGNEFKFSN